MLTRLWGAQGAASLVPRTEQRESNMCAFHFRINFFFLFICLFVLVFGFEINVHELLATMNLG